MSSRAQQASLRPGARLFVADDIYVGVDARYRYIGTRKIAGYIGVAALKRPG
jgi:hypothetical protein